MSYELSFYLEGNSQILNIPRGPLAKCDRKKGNAMLENSPHLCFAKQAPLFWKGSSVSWKKKKRSWDACGKQLARLIVGRSHILHGHDRRSIRKDLAFPYLEKVPLLSHLGKNIESCIFLQNNIRWDQFMMYAADCKTLTIVKLSVRLSTITARWESVLVINALFGRHERSPLLFYLLPMFFQALERWRMWLLQGGVEIHDGGGLWLAHSRDRFLWTDMINMLKHDVLTIRKFIDLKFDLYLRGGFAPLYDDMWSRGRLKFVNRSHPTEYRDITAEVSPHLPWGIFFLLFEFDTWSLEVVLIISIIWDHCQYWVLASSYLHARWVLLLAVEARQHAPLEKTDRYRRRSEYTVRGRTLETWAN